MSKEPKRDSEFQKKLDNLSCPFTWNIDDAITSYYTTEKFEREEEKEEDDDQKCSILLFNVISVLMKCYEQVIKDNMEKSEQKLREADQILENIKQLNSKELDGTIRAFEHVFNATKCHIFYKQENVKGAENILQNLISTSCMTRKELGALDGIQSAAWSFYHDFGKNKAVELATNATRLNPENSFWHFILAKNLRRCRRNVTITSHPGKTEREGFEKAYDISKNPLYGVYLAQMYRESMYEYGPIPAWQRTQTEKKIVNIYNEILKSGDLSSFVISRLVLGFIRMNTMNARDKAKECLNILEKKSRNQILYPIFLHYKALYLEKFEPSNITERLKYLKAAGELNNFVADMGYAECGVCAGLDPIEHLQKMLLKYDNCVKDRQLTMLLGIATSYYLKNNMKNAAEYYLKALEVDPNSQKLKGFYRFATFTTKKEQSKSIYCFLINKFLPKLHAASDASLKEMHLKIKQICQKYMGGDTTSLDDHMKNMKL